MSVTVMELMKLQACDVFKGTVCAGWTECHLAQLQDRHRDPEEAVPWASVRGMFLMLACGLVRCFLGIGAIFSSVVCI